MNDNITTYNSTRTVPSSQRSNNTDVIRIDLKKIDIRPTGAQLTTYTDLKLAVWFRLNTRDICLCLNEMKDKVAIPLNQMVGFRVAEYKEIEVQLLNNFKRSYYHNNIEVKGDPTNGLLEGATSLTFTTLPSVMLNTLVAVESAIIKYKTECQNNSLINNSQVNNSQMYVTWVLFVERGAVVVPCDISLSTLLNHIGNKFNLQLNSERISYKNGVGEMIALRDEEDWKVAKWEAKYEKRPGVEVHLA
ncbi:15225_t:CDS:2 [Dentiscutata erythropus]|uniref:15225_t:CDS:1 n=1 Tax=Dentiscutata erythropus TaxID=1348616 RepID=A0A9N8W5N8_9GLOM|nr:15225_t:CDS:2 [Dentiscutata erythropus]